MLSVITMNRESAYDGMVLGHGEQESSAIRFGRTSRFDLTVKSDAPGLARMSLRILSPDVPRGYAPNGAVVLEGPVTRGQVDQRLSKDFLMDLDDDRTVIIRIGPRHYGGVGVLHMSWEEKEMLEPIRARRKRT